MKKKHDYNVQFELLKTIAENNNEEMFQYDVETDRAVFFAVQDGDFVEKVTFENYIEKLPEYLAALSEEHRIAYMNAIEECLKGPCHKIIEVQVPLNGNGKLDWQRLFFASIVGNPEFPDKVTAIAGRFMSIQDQKDREDSIRKKAEIDALTGVYNHATFENLCERVLQEQSSDIMFLMIDVDDFKMINDSLGHNVGDMVLSQTGEILKYTVQNRGYAGRLGGDEFAIIVWGLNGKADVDEFCELLVNNLKNIIFDMEYSASMGVAIRDGRFLTFKDLYYEADQAVYFAKKNGKNQLVFYEDVLKQKEKHAEDEDSFEYDESGIDEFEKAVMNNNPEYIIVTCMEERKILFMNRAARSASIMDEYSLGQFIKQPISETCVEVRDYRHDINDVYMASIESERGESFVSQIFGACNLFMKIEFGVINNRRIERLSLTNLSDRAHVNQVYRSKDKSSKTIHELFDYVTTGYSKDSEYKFCAKKLLNYYGADCAVITYYDENEQSHVVQSHKASAETTAKLVDIAAKNGTLEDFLVLYNDEGSAFVDDIKVIKKSNPTLYNKLADSRIWSFEGSIINVDNKLSGAVFVLNPRENACDRKLIDMITSFIGSQISVKKMENIYQYGESHDKITGLLKREKFKKWDIGNVELVLESLGIFLTDIVNLKAVNSSFGYATGNNRLKVAAETLREVFSGYYLYRFDDDEFLAFCPDISQEDFEKLSGEMKKRLDELDFAVAGGISWSENVNIGKQLIEAEELLNVDKDRLRQENVPLYKQAKKIIKDVEDELNQGRFSVFLQPKVNMNTGKTVGAEALVRLYSEEFGVIPPLRFIPILEENNAVHMIDLFVLDRVCMFQREKMDAGLEIVPISVNFSKKTLIHPNLIDAVKEIMERHDTPKGIVQIEITETVSDMDQLIISNIANSLRNMGFELAMDDFGTKYANMETLVNFQFGIAKVDRSLVKDITKNAKSVIMLRHLTAMLKELDISCVIEGVETKEQIDILKNMNCDVIQGFFYGKPTPSEDFYRLFME